VNVKLVAYVAAAGTAGLAGALFTPALIGIVPSIQSSSAPSRWRGAGTSTTTDA
jgi:hypothetical protein